MLALLRASPPPKLASDSENARKKLWQATKTQGEDWGGATLARKKKQAMKKSEEKNER